MNTKKQFEAPVLYRALLKIIAKEGKNEMERFLVQQNIIQYRLTFLIEMRSGIIDKKLIDWIENVPLGTLINVYKICMRRNKTELKLIVQLNDYNKKRNNLVHKLMNTKHQKEMARTRTPNFGVKATNALGMEIIEGLERFIMEGIYKK
jgi:hypothetical protein